MGVHKVKTQISQGILPAPRLLNLFHAQLNWAWNFNCSLKLKYRQMKKFLALSLSDVVFIMLINVKMPTNFWHFNFCEQNKFRAQLSWVWKKFYNLGPSLIIVFCLLCAKWVNMDPLFFHADTKNDDYCKFDNFIFANSVKRHICDVNNSQQGDYLSSSVNKRMISPFREFYFHETSHMRRFAKIKPSRIFPNLLYTVLMPRLTWDVQYYFWLSEIITLLITLSPYLEP